MPESLLPSDLDGTKDADVPTTPFSHQYSQYIADILESLYDQNCTSTQSGPSHTEPATTQPNIASESHDNSIETRTGAIHAGPNTDALTQTEAGHIEPQITQVAIASESRQLGSNEN
jgi:hypothetical protein